jgi:hypothetical protein
MNPTSQVTDIPMLGQQPYESFYMLRGKVHSSKYNEPVTIKMKEGEIRFGCSKIEMDVIKHVIKEYDKYFCTKHIDLQ